MPGEIFTPYQEDARQLSSQFETPGVPASAEVQTTEIVRNFEYVTQAAADRQAELDQLNAIAQDTFEPTEQEARPLSPEDLQPIEMRVPAEQLLPAIASFGVNLSHYRRNKRIASGSYN